MIPSRAVLRGEGMTLVMSNQETPGDEVEAYLHYIDGWFGGVGVDDPGAQRSLGHGYFSIPSRRASREITLKATYVFAEERGRALADRLVSGVLWDGEFGELEVTIGEQSLFSRVKLAGEVKHQHLGSHAFEVQIPLTAPDPRLYGPTRTYQLFPAGFGQGLKFPLFGSATGALDWGKGAPYNGAFGNSGNSTAYPIFTVRGEWPSGFVISEGQKAIEYPSPVTATSPVQIDCLTGSVTSQEADQTYRLSRRDWIEVPARTSIQPTIHPLAPSQGWCDVAISDTYM